MGKLFIPKGLDWGQRSKRFDLSPIIYYYFPAETQILPILNLVR